MYTSRLLTTTLFQCIPHYPVHYYRKHPESFYLYYTNEMVKLIRTYCACVSMILQMIYCLGILFSMTVCEHWQKSSNATKKNNTVKHRKGPRWSSETDISDSLKKIGKDGFIGKISYNTLHVHQSQKIIWLIRYKWYCKVCWVNTKKHNSLALVHKRNAEAGEDIQYTTRSYSWNAKNADSEYLEYFFNQGQMLWNLSKLI